MAKLKEPIDTPYMPWTTNFVQWFGAVTRYLFRTRPGRKHVPKSH